MPPRTSNCSRLTGKELTAEFSSGLPKLNGKGAVRVEFGAREVACVYSRNAGAQRFIGSVSEHY